MSVTFACTFYCARPCALHSNTLLLLWVVTPSHTPSCDGIPIQEHTHRETHTQAGYVLIAEGHYTLSCQVEFSVTK